MRILLSVALAAAFAIPAFSQQATQAEIVRRQFRRLLEEKLHRPDLDDFRPSDWAAYAGQTNGISQLPPADLAASIRSSEIIVHNDAKAESEIHAVINPTDTSNLIVASILQNPQNILAPLDVPIYYTLDFGQTWKSSKITFSPNASDGFVAGGGDPVLAFDDSGNAYLSWLVLTLNITTSQLKLALYLSTSTDKGATWSAATLIDRGIADFGAIGGNGTGTIIDKQWMAIDHTNGANKDRLYVSYTYFEILDSTNALTKILVKSKSGTSNIFSAAVPVNHGSYAMLQFSSIDVDPAGNVHVLFFGGNSDDDIALYHTISTDGGTSFQPEVQISTLYFPGLIDGSATDTIPGMPADRLYPCPHIKAGTTPGTLFATWSASGVKSKETPGFDIWLAKSADNGATWSPATRVNSDVNPSAQQYYPTLTVSPNGALCISYYDRTDDPTGTNTNYVMTYSTDDGASFSAVQKTSTAAANFAQIGLLNGNFGIGEYTQIVATEYYAIPIWADGRSNNGDIDVYAAIVPLFDQASGAGEIGTITDAFSITAPNPSHSNIRLNISLNQSASFSIRIFNADGRLVYTEPAGIARETGHYDRSIPAPPGIYWCTMETTLGFKTLRIIVL